MELKNLKIQSGFSTIEMLIAFTVVVLGVSAVISVVFGSQSMGLDTETNQEAQLLGQSLLEDGRATSRQDFNSVNSTSPVVAGIYTTQTDVSDISPCAKIVTSNIDWTIESRPQYARLTTTLTYPEEALRLAGDCASTAPAGDDWKRPKKLDVSAAGMEGHGTAFDVKNKIIFLVSKITGSSKDDFFIIDATDRSNPIAMGFLDLSDGPGGDGLEDIDVAGNYAFVANDEAVDTNQLKVIDVSNLNTPSLVNETTLPGVTGSCPFTCPGGRSLRYYNDKIYIGTHRLVAFGAAEFHVYDVSSPVTPVWEGSKGGAFLGDAVDHNINDIVVREQTIGGVTRTYAYLATSGDSSELIILNVTDPSTIPDPTGTADTGSIVNLGSTSVGDLDATEVYIIGNRAYVGRKRATGAEKDFYVLDISNPAAVTVLGSLKLGLNATGSGVSGIRVSGNLAFIGTTDPDDPFMVWDISNPVAIVRWEAPGCAINFSTFVTDIEFEDNLIYTSMDAKQHNPKIIEPTGGTCS